MKVVTVGSRIFDDALVRCHEKINNEKRIVGVSPFSIYGKFDLADMPPMNVAYEERMFLYQYNHNMTTDLDNIEFDYLIIDFLSAAADLLECEKEDGEKLYVLEHPWLKRNLNMICEKYKIKIGKQFNPVSWPPHKIREEISKLCDYLLAVVPKEKIVMLKTFIPYQYIEDNVIKTGDAGDIVCKNQLIELCQDIFADLISPYTIEIPYNFVRMDKEVDSYNIKFNSENYEWIVKSFFQNLSENGFEDDYINNAANEQQKFLDSIALMSMEDAIRNNSKNRKLIILCERPDIDGMNWQDIEFIPYNRVMKETDIEAALRKYKGLNQNYFFVLPHIYNESNILRILWKLGYMIRKDIAIYQILPIVLNNFEGKYIDCFNNRIEVKNKTSIRISGIGCNVAIENTKHPQRISISDLRDEARIFVGENVMADGLKLKALWAGDIAIGKKSSFAEKCYLIATGYFDVIIGIDTMFSTEVVCHAGDGHAIYDFNLENAVNNQYDEHKSTGIIVEDHVWIGYQAMLLKGAHVGVGSILGARTVLSKTVPNNCIVAGIPGKVIHKDIYWEREPFTDKIENPEYANPTLIEENANI